MSFFRWNPIRLNREGVTQHTEFSRLPIIFVPRHYVRQRKRGLYNNLLVLLGGLWALTISHDMDNFETEATEKLKNILGTSCLFVSHLVATPLIIRKLRLHYSIVLGAMGMSVTPFFYYLRNAAALSVMICLRNVFVALFDVSSTIYAMKLARICSRMRGNAVSTEILTARCYATIFGCTARLVSSAWGRYLQESEIKEEAVGVCGPSVCARKLSRKARLAGTLSAGQSTILIAVSIVVALSGVILIAMYLKPIGSFGETDLSEEPRISSPYEILKQFGKPGAKRLALLIISCIFVHGINDEFVLAYVTCSFSLDYLIFVTSMKELSVMFGAMSCLTLVDFVGFYWLYAIALLGQMSCCACFLVWHFRVSETQSLHMILYHLLFASVSVEISILHLLVMQTLGNEEVAAWCFYHLVADASFILRNVAVTYLCTAVKLWIVIAIGPIAVIALATYSRGFGVKICLEERCSLLVKTSKRNFAKPATFDLKIVVEESRSIRKVETLLERRYTLASRRLFPPPTDAASETFLEVQTS